MVTFLFTDVEGSTKLWDVFPDDMRTALTLHDEIVVSSATQHGGTVVKHTGDGLFIVFASAPDGFAAAIDAQRRLAAADWPLVVGSLGVRMALHTAEVEPTGDDYYSPDVNRTARIEAAGHGGQVLLSSSTHEVVADSLPEGVQILDLGEHTLRGLSNPERIHQATIAGLRASFPPLRTASVIKGRLPSFPTPFIGRSAEVERLVEETASPQCRVLTLQGPGGIGKTRLGVEVAAKAAAANSSVAHFLPLEPITDATHIVKALADSIGFVIDIHVSSVLPEKTQVFDRLRSQPMVLVLDNAEHLADVGDLVAEMATQLDNVTLIVTSRRRLGILSEQVVSVEGLTADGQDLFIDRARRAGGNPDPGDRAIDELVAMLGGMPLAIELSAAWTPLLSVTEIAAEIRRDLDFLTSEGRDLPERHRSVRAVFEQSWKRLDPELRDALARLSVFPAPFSREAASAIAGAALPQLLTLVTASLLQRDPLAGAFSLHPLLREFAADRLGDGRAEIEERYAHFYLDTLRRSGDELERGPDQLGARDALVEDLDHIYAAAEWSMRYLPDDEAALVVNRMDNFLFLYSWVDQVANLRHLADVIVETHGREAALQRSAYRLARACEAVGQTSFLSPEEIEAIVAPLLADTVAKNDLAHACSLLAHGIAVVNRGEYEESLDWLGRAGEVPIDHSSKFSWILGAWLGWSQLQFGRSEEARSTFQAALQQATDDRHEIGRAFLLSKLGSAADQLGDHRLASQYHHEGREIFVKANDLGGQGFTLSRLSWTHYLMENYDLARRYGLEGLEKFEEMNHRWGIAVSHGRIGLAEIKLDNPLGATERFVETLAVAEASQLPDQLHYGVIGIGLALTAMGRDTDAARLLAGSAAAEKNPYADFATPALDEMRERDAGAVEAAERAAPTFALAELVADARRLAAALAAPPTG